MTLKHSSFGKQTYDRFLLRRLLCVLLAVSLTMLLLAGCSRRFVFGNGKNRGTSSRAILELSDTGPEDKEQIDYLMESWVLPYEAVAGGYPFENPESIPAQYVVYLGMSHVIRQVGMDTFYVENEGGNRWPLFPQDLIHEATQYLFGVQPSALKDTYDELVYSDIEQDYSGLRVPDTSTGLKDRPSQLYGASQLEASPRPAYQVTLSQAQKTAKGVYQIVVRRTLAASPEDIQLPDVTYTFAPPNAAEPPKDVLFSERDMRLVSVQADVNEYFTEISSAEQLLTLSRLVNAGDKTYLGHTIRLVNDIDLTGCVFEPIGDWKRFTYNGANMFEGIFDGNGHTISNLKIHRPYDELGDTGMAPAVGFFAYTGLNARISDLHLKDVDIVGQNAVGGLAGSFCGQMRHCTVTGTVKGYSDVGGLFGRAWWWYSSPLETEVIGCQTDVAVTGSVGTGGIAGFAGYGWYEGCTAKGTLDITAPEGESEQELAASRAGGFAGTETQAVIRNCFASVNIRTHTQAGLIGQFVGISEYAAISQSFCNADAGGAWDPVDDAYGGTVSCTALPRAAYEAQLAQLDPLTYEKKNGVCGIEMNPTLLLAGLVDFPQDTLAVLVYHPDEALLTRIQDYTQLTANPEEAVLLIPVHNHTDITLLIYKADLTEYRKDMLFAENIDAGNGSGYALLFDSFRPKDSLDMHVLIFHAELNAEYVYSYPGKQEDKVLYLVGRPRSSRESLS